VGWEVDILLSFFPVAGKEYTLCFAGYGKRISISVLPGGEKCRALLSYCVNRKIHGPDISEVISVYSRH
jgi:hypothetical protein